MWILKIISKFEYLVFENVENEYILFKFIYSVDEIYADISLFLTNNFMKPQFLPSSRRTYFICSWFWFRREECLQNIMKSHLQTDDDLREIIGLLNGCR